MNLKALKQHYIQELQLNYSREESEALFFLVVEKLSGWSRSKVLFNQDTNVEPAQVDAYYDVVTQLQQGVPIQYILGEAHFYGMDWIVNNNVLIPRAETEELVDWIILEGKSQAISSILDIGTGSGCIAVSLKKYMPGAEVAAIDISAGAIQTAKENASRQGLDVEFITADILTYQSSKQYQLIVSNPPYVKEDEKQEMRENVLNHEPHTALFVSNENPLIFYKAIADFALSNLLNRGLLFFEINEYLGAETVAMLTEKGFEDIILRKDMQGKDRMIVCRKP